MFVCSICVVYLYCTIEPSLSILIPVCSNDRFAAITPQHTIRDVLMVSLWDTIVICMKYWQLFTELQVGWMDGALAD